jgi:hypothetical protein
MKYIIEYDEHKHLSLFVIYEEEGKRVKLMRMEHPADGIQELLSKFPDVTPVSLESIGNWYWIVDEIDTDCCKPLMAYTSKAKVMMGNVNITDKLDARG